MSASCQKIKLLDERISTVKLLTSAMALLRLIFILTICLSSGCANPLIAKARLYNFNSGTLGTAYINDLKQHYGRITAELADGEKLQGEFTLTHETATTPPRVVRLAFEELGMDSNETERKLAQEHEKRTLATIFGYGNDADARPVATATLVGNQGTVLDLVFYSLNLQRGEGNGVGRDNQGNWYLIRSGI